MTLVLGNSYLLPPGNCFFCGSPDGSRGVVDTGRDIDFYGRLYFCVICSRDLGFKVGLLAALPTPTPVAEVITKDEFYESVANLLDDLERLSTSIKLLDNNRSEADSESKDDSGESKSANPKPGELTSLKKPPRVSDFDRSTESKFDL